MPKRFIDTGLFDDSWFMDLSLEAKITWIYLITKCDHAGIIEINNKLFKVQTGINSFDTVKQELGNRIVRVREQYYFIPKFISYQYPNFPNSNAKAQNSAIEILKKFDLIDNSTGTVKQEFTNSYGKDKDKDKDNGNGNNNGNSEGSNNKISEIDFLKLFNDITKKKYRVLDDEARQQLKERSQEGFTLEDFRRAIINCKNDDWHKKNTRYLTPVFITKAEKLQSFLNKTDRKQVNQPWDDPGGKIGENM